jgi:SPP1 gp7 family putative phage head morphogenesis protein
MQSWFDRLNDGMRFDMARAVKLGVSLGETNAQIARRIVGAGGDKGPEVLPKGRRDAFSVTRTAVQTIANDARLATFEANEDIIKEVQWISTLDSRTSDICVARSGLIWTFPGYKPKGHDIPWLGGPPAHWACRSTVIPITKTFRELGIDQDEVPASTRASMDGQIAADTTFAQFLASKPPQFADEMLGKGRAQLWRDGKITLQDLLNPKGVPLTLRQLEAEYGMPSTVEAKVASTEAQQALGEIDTLIEAMQAFEYSDAYLAAKAKFDESRRVYDEVYERYKTLTYDQQTQQEAERMVQARRGYWESRDALLPLETAEKARAVSLLDLPANRRAAPSDLIDGAVPPATRKAVAEATSIISRLVDKRVAPRVSVATNRSKRAFYTDRNHTIHINGNTSVSTVVHEIMHDLEFRYSEVSAKSKAFLLKRADGQAPRSLKSITGLKYRADEKAYEDQWVKRGGDAYMGKIYPDKATELVTMGMERMIANPKRFADQDPEYFRFMLELIRGVL